MIPDPTDVSVEEGARVAINENIDGIIGIGGGSAMDSAKAINTLIHSSFPIDQYFAELGPDAKVPNPGVPMILIPSSAIPVLIMQKTICSYLQAYRIWRS